jgi:hypothetical protein
MSQKLDFYSLKLEFKLDTGLDAHLHIQTYILYRQMIYAKTNCELSAEIHNRIADLKSTIDYEITKQNKPKLR